MNASRELGTLKYNKKYNKGQVQNEYHHVASSESSKKVKWPSRLRDRAT
jgi:hypothetical protein